MDLVNIHHVRHISNQILNIQQRRLLKYFFCMDHKLIFAHPEILGFDSMEDGPKEIEYLLVDTLPNTKRINIFLIQEIHSFEYLLDHFHELFFVCLFLFFLLHIARHW